MALPYLVKHIYSYGTEEVIRRGKRIFALKNIELVKLLCRLMDQKLGESSNRPRYHTHLALS